jgi:hypothetical protein
LWHRIIGARFSTSFPPRQRCRGISGWWQPQLQEDRSAENIVACNSTYSPRFCHNSMRLGRIVGPSTSRRSALVQPGHVWPQPLRTHTAARSRIVMAAVDSHTLGGLATSSSSSSSSSTAAASPVPPWRARRGGQQQQQLGRGRGRWRPAGAANSNTVPYTVSEELVATFAAAGK